MQSILAALEEQRKLKQSGIVAILEAGSNTPNTKVHAYLKGDDNATQAPPPPGGRHSELVFPPVYDHTGQIIQIIVS
jgi:hypothetical protein